MTNQQKENAETTKTGISDKVSNAPLLEKPENNTPAIGLTSDLNLKEGHTEFADFHEGYIRHYISFADTKAGVIFALASSIAGYLLSNEKFQTVLLAPACTSAFVIGSLGLFLLSLAAILSFLIIAPRLSSPSKEGIVFFGAVADRTSGAEFVRDISKLSKSELTAARLKHSYDTSLICNAKYELLKKSIWLLGPGVLLALLAFLVILK